MRTRRKDEGTGHLQRNAKGRTRHFSIFIWQERHKWEISLIMGICFVAKGEAWACRPGAGWPPLHDKWGQDWQYTFLSNSILSARRSATGVQPWVTCPKLDHRGWTHPLLKSEKFRNLKEKIDRRGCSEQWVRLEGCSSYPEQPSVCPFQWFLENAKYLKASPKNIWRSLMPAHV